jgi:PAS domain S-box-containing protein
VERAFGDSEIPLDCNLLIDGMTAGFALHEMICDDSGRPVDYRYLRVNDAFCGITGFDSRNVEGRLISELCPGLEPRWLERYALLVETGNPLHFEDIITTTGCCCEISSYRPAPGLFISLYNDLSRRRKVEKALVESEQRYHFAIEAIDDAIWDINNETGTMYWSPKYYTMLGYRPGDINPTFEQLEKLIDPADRAVAMDAYRRCETGESDQLFETLRFITRSGEIRWIETKGRVMSRKDGRILRFVGTNRDVHNLTEARLRLREQEDLFRTIFEQAMVGIAVLDGKGWFLRVNQRFSDICGYNEEELKQLKFTQITTKEDLATERAFFNEVRSGTRDSFVMEKRYRHKSGREIWILLYARVLRRADRHIDRIIAIINDITSRREAEHALLESRTLLEQQNREYQRINEELSREKVRAEESDRLKTAFLTNMSHEIRTPLNGILGFADMLSLEGLTVEEKGQFVGVIKESGQQLLAILNDIIDISRIETGQFDIRHGPVVLTELLDELYRFHHPLAEKKGLTLLVDRWSGPEPVRVQSDYVRLKQVLGNLIGNAIKFTWRGGISFGYRMEGERIVFSVRDTGPGIPDDKKELIFERFRQLGPGSGSVVSGNGLGLSICRAYVRAMGGEIGVHSGTRSGSEFFFDIPYCKIGPGEGE